MAEEAKALAEAGDAVNKPAAEPAAGPVNPEAAAAPPADNAAANDSADADADDAAFVSADDNDDDDDDDDDSFDSFESAQESTINGDAQTVTSHIGMIDSTVEPTVEEDEDVASSSGGGQQLIKESQLLQAQQSLGAESQGYYSSTSNSNNNNIPIIDEDENEDSSSYTPSLVSIDIPLITDAAVDTPALANTPAANNAPALGEATPFNSPTAVNTPGSKHLHRMDSRGTPPTPVCSALNSLLDNAVNSLEGLSSEYQGGTGNADDNEEEASISSDSAVKTRPPEKPSSSSSSSRTTAADSNNMELMAPLRSSDPLRASITSVNSAGEQSQGTLPSYNFRPVVREKSDRILRSYKPSVASRFRGASLLAFRRGRSSAGGGGESGGGDDDNNNNGAKSSSNLSSVEEGSIIKKNEARTEVTESVSSISNNNNNNHSSTPSLSIGSLLKDTYSFLYVYPICSAPFAYAILLFSFQSLVYALLLSSLIDTGNPGNMLHVPQTVALEMRIAQACAIFIAVVNSVDVMVALNNLLRKPDKIVVLNSSFNNENHSNNHNGGGEMQMQDMLAESRPGLSSSNMGPQFSPMDRVGSNLGPQFSPVGAKRPDDSCDADGSSGSGQSFPAGFKFKFANCLRLIEGCLSTTASFILIVQADDVIEMFINFAALEFVVNLDNLAFALAEHGLISDRLQDAAQFIDGLGFAYHDHQNLSSTGRRRAMKGNRGGGASCSPGRVAQLKGSYISRLFGSPYRFAKKRPDGIRRTTLLIMTLTLFGCWGWILLGLNEVADLPNSIDVDFFHAHVEVASRADAEEGLKPFLASRDGNYVAAFVEEEPTILNQVINLFSSKNDPFLIYRKMDPKVETPQKADTFGAPASLLPKNYVEVLFYDTVLQAWVFTSCAPDANSLEDMTVACAGPQVRSTETEDKDLDALMSSSAMFHVFEDGKDETEAMMLPVTIKSNECGRPVATQEGVAAEMSCGVSGGFCSEPLEEYGLARQCICPTGQYGPYCADHYGASCAFIEILNVQAPDAPPGAVELSRWEQTQFNLIEDERGVGNTPVWERKIESRGYVDRLEWRGGGYWAITREQVTLRTVHTIAIAEGTTTPASGMDGSANPGTVAGGTGLALDVQQPPPAGLMFHAPKSAAWGTEPDYYRPLSSYQFHCKAGGVVPDHLQLNARPK